MTSLRGMMIVCVVPEVFIQRVTKGPLMREPSGFFATGRCMVWLVAVGVTSPCHPETNETRPSGPGVAVPLPRLTTE